MCSRGECVGRAGVIKVRGMEWPGRKRTRITCLGAPIVHLWRHGAVPPSASPAPQEGPLACTYLTPTHRCPPLTPFPWILCLNFACCYSVSPFLRPFAVMPPPSSGYSTWPPPPAPAGRPQRSCTSSAGGGPSHPSRPGAAAGPQSPRRAVWSVPTRYRPPRRPWSAPPPHPGRH